MDSVTFEAVEAEAIRYSTRFSGLMRRGLIRFRPHICPFELILNEIPEGAAIFDIGCGSGFILHAAATLRSTVRAAGVDYNAEVIVMAKAALGRYFPEGGCTLTAGATPDSWPAGQFDAVTIIDVLHHLSEEEQAGFLREAGRRVRPGGVIIVKDMARRPLWSNIMNRMHDLLLARQWIRTVDEEPVVAALAEQGFAVTARNQKRLYWYAHWLVAMVKQGN